MVKSKVELTYIQDDVEREATYKKLMKQLQKRAKKLKADCGVDVLAIAYKANSTEPDVWPTCREKAAEVIMKFKERSDIGQAHNMTQETFLSQRVENNERKFMWMKKRNDEMDLLNVVADLLDGKPVEQVPYGNLADLTLIIQDSMKTIQDRISVMEETAKNANPDQNPNTPL